MSMRPVEDLYTSVLTSAQLAWLFVVSALLLSATVLQAADESDWRVDNAPYRMAFSVPSHVDTQLLAKVSLPSDVANDTGIGCYDLHGREVEFRVVSREEGSIWVLISLGADPDSEYHVYFGDPGVTGRAREDLVDPAPVGVSLFRSGAQGLPNSWEKMRYMARMQPNARVSFQQHHFGRVDTSEWVDHASPHTHFPEPARAGPPNANGVEDKPRHRRPRNPDPGPLPIVKLDTHFLCPASGVYSFAVDSRDVAYVLMDGELVASRSDEGPDGSWHPGDPVQLDAGVHRLEVFHKTKRAPSANVGWQTPEQDAIHAIPATLLLSSCVAEKTRMDRKNDSFRPDMSFSIGAAYAFRDCPVVFVPVDFKATANAAGADVVYSWDFGDGETATGKRATHTFKVESLYTVTLSVREGDSPVRTMQAVVDCRMVRMQHYVLAPQIIGLPAVCYASDALAPALLIDGQTGSRVALDVYWTVDGADGSQSQTVQTSLDREPTRLPIASRPAGELSQITWSVSHLDVQLCRETVKFLKAPFAELPMIAHGERLHNADGDRIVLVPFRQAGEFSQPAITLSRAFGRLVCIDDSLAVSGMHGDFYEATYYRRLGKLLDGPDRPIVDHVALRNWGDESEIYGPLLRLLDAPAAVEGADVVVLSVGLPDIAWDSPLGEFERHVAAMVDILSATKGCPVVLVTPPPFRDTASDVRAYAAAVQRVAQARDIPVADVYSAFMSAGEENGDLFVGKSGFVLSGRGHHLAARVMARAILMQSAGGQ